MASKRAPNPAGLSIFFPAYNDSGTIASMVIRAVKAASASPAQVTLLGNQPQDRIARLVAAADLVAVPSVRDDAGNVDGLPNFALEALASGTPVVASRAGGLPQAIEDGVTGLLVPERDPQALARAMAACLERPEWARGLGQHARLRVIRDFGWARVAERFESAYNSRT